jgi:intracellular septation protein
MTVERNTASSQGQGMSPQLKLALDFGPLLLFFIANAALGIFAATAVIMVAISCAVIVEYSLEKHVSPMLLVTFVLVLVFGGLTLWLANENFIKIKPTILYAMFASVLLVGLLFNRLFIKVALGRMLNLSDAAWRTLTWRWSFLFIILAILNEIIWRSVSTNLWVAFKVWGVTTLTFIFAMAQTPFIARHQIDSDKSPPLE